MIRKIFLTEWKGYAIIGGAGILLCVLAGLGFGLAGVNAADSVRADIAENAFFFFNAISYAVPLLLLLRAIFTFCKAYRVAGVTEEKIALGALSLVFVWTAASLAALMLFVTLYDFVYFAGTDAVRGQIYPKYLMLSLRMHGIGRLLFAPSVAVTVSLAYIVYDVVRTAIRRPHHLVWKIIIATVFLIFSLFYQYMVIYATSFPGTLADASWLVPPDSLIPVLPAVPGEIPDAVKNVHYLAAPILNLVFWMGELFFGVFLFGFIRVIGRCKNEIVES